MPQVIPLVIYAIGTYFAVPALLVTAATLVSSLAISQYQRRKAERQQKAAYDASQVDRLANVPATTAPRELVLGRVRKGGNVFFRGSAGQFKQLFSMCITLAGHEIDAVEQVYFNNVPVTIDGSGNVTTFPYGKNTNVSATEIVSDGSVLAHTPIGGSLVIVATSRSTQDNTYTSFTPSFSLSGNTLTIPGYDVNYEYRATYQYIQFTTCATVRWYLGAPGQTADARLQGLFPGVWGPNHRADGIAYLAVDFVYDETAMPSGMPNVTALVRGAKCYDPRTGLTQFTENPAIMQRHVLLHPQFGKRAALTANEDARIIAAANACDTAFSYTGSDNVAQYRASTVVPFGSPARDVLDDLAQAMGGQWAYASGELFVKAGVYQAPVLSLGEADLAVVQRGTDGSVSQSQITISSHKPRAQKVNSIAARIWDQAAGYIETPLPPFTSASYVSADGGVVLSQEVQMPAVFYAPQANAIAGIILRDSRDPQVVTLPFKLTAYPVELFDGVTLTLPRYGWVNKEFQVLGRRFFPTGVIELTLKETSSSIYAYGAPFIPQGYASNSTLPNPWDISPPTITSVTSGDADLIVQADGTVVNGVRVNWAPIGDASVTSAGSVEVGYLLYPYTAWQTVTVPGDSTSVVIPGIADGAVVVLNARARNTLAISAWGVQVKHTVIGKSAPPPDIENLTIAGSVLSWTLSNPPRDLAGYVFRFQYGNNLDWNSASPLNDGIVTESPWEPKLRPNGVVTIMGKAIDTSGNVSLATANIVMNLGDPLIANVVEQWDFNALGWPFEVGSQSNWTLVSGKPSANSLDSFYGTDDQSFYGADIDSFYEPGAYAQMVYVTQEVRVGAALAGSIMTLAVTAQGTDLKIDYRLSGPTSFYGLDNSSFYGDAADPFYDAPGDWMPWPGQIIAANEVYQFRVTIGAGPTRGILQTMVLTIDAPDLSESLADVAISSGGTAVPYTKDFTAIKTVHATLQANGSGGVTVEVDKTVPLSPVIRVFNSSHVAVSGATVDIDLQGY